MREQGGEASKAAGSELIISLCKAGDRREALKVYEDMTSPTPTHPPHAPHPLATKRISKSAAKRQRAKQRQEADVAAAVGSAVRASGAAATAVALQPAGPSETEQEEINSHHGRGGARKQTANSSSVAETTFGAPLASQTAEQPAATGGVMSLPSTPERSAASDSQSASDAHSTSPTPPPKGLGAESWTDPVKPSEQATASDPAHGDSSDLQTPEAAPDLFSSTNSNTNPLIRRPRARPPVSTLLSKPDRRQPSIPAVDTQAGSPSEQASDVPQRHDPAELLLHPSDSDVYTFGSSQQGQDHSPDGKSGVNLGSRGDKGGGREGPQAGAVLGKRPVAPVGSNDGSQGHARLVGSLKLSQRAICFPSIGATAALVHAFAIVDDIQQCFR